MGMTLETAIAALEWGLCASIGLLQSHTHPTAATSAISIAWKRSNVTGASATTGDASQASDAGVENES